MMDNFIHHLLFMTNSFTLIYTYINPYKANMAH